MAGQRVQIIKKDGKGGGKLQFGTEVVSSSDGTLTALLGASPGASTSVSIMIDLLHEMFKDEMRMDSWRAKIKEMIPTFGSDLIQDGELCKRTRDRTGRVLKLL